MNVFSKMAALVTVNDVKGPLGPALRPDQSVRDAFELLWEEGGRGAYDPAERVSLVLGDEGVVGAVFLEDLEAERNVGECMTPISPAALVADNTRVLDALDLVEDPITCRYVLSGKDLVGTLRYSDFFRLPFTLCLFALTLEVEQVALDVLGANPRQAWDALPAKRQQQAEAVYQARFGKSASTEKPSARDLLECTYFADKSRLLEDLHLLPREWIKKFNRAETIRNLCAHPGDETSMASKMDDVGGLRAAVADMSGLVSKLRELGSARR